MITHEEATAEVARLRTLFRTNEIGSYDYVRQQAARDAELSGIRKNYYDAMEMVHKCGATQEAAEMALAAKDAELAATKKDLKEMQDGRNEYVDKLHSALDAIDALGERVARLEKCREVLALLKYSCDLTEAKTGHNFLNAEMREDIEAAMNSGTQKKGKS